MSNIGKPIDFVKENLELSSETTLWRQSAINGLKWNKYFPYQLLILKVTAKGTYEQVWSYTLPISPQDINIDMPIATNLQATLSGIVEQHGGAPFRDITLSGTTGVHPNKGVAVNKSETGPANNFAQSVFGGTVTASQEVKRAATELVGQVEQLGHVYKTTDLDTRGTGYYQFRLLERFIESYVNLKSKAQYSQLFNCDTRDLRLALAIWKEDAVYLCSGVKLGRRRTANTPNQYLWSLGLRAWSRIILQPTFTPTDNHDEHSLRQPNVKAQILNALTTVRERMAAGQKVLDATIGGQDGFAALEVIRQLSYVLKDATNAVLTVRDFPDDIRKGIINTAIRDWDRTKRLLSSIGFPLDEDDTNLDRLAQEQKDRKKNIDAFNNGLVKDTNSYTSPDQNTQNTLDQLKAINKANALTNAGKAKSALEQERLRAQRDLEANKKLSEKEAEKLMNLNPQQMQLPPVLSQAIKKEIQRIKDLKREDYIKMKADIKRASDALAAKVGASGDTYDSLNGLTSSSLTPSREQLEVLWTLDSLMSILDKFISTMDIKYEIPSSLEYVAGLAEASGIAFQIPTSKFPVPFPYGTTLEQLALTYLKDADRWHEIATLNGLRAPYIDEIGFSISLLTNPVNNQVHLDTIDNLFIGQVVYVTANGLKRLTRRITNIKFVSANHYIVYLDDGDMSNYTTDLEAKLQSFLPGTVNSNQIIFIPSPNEAQSDLVIKAIPGVDMFDPLLTIGGIDWLLTTSNELIVTPDGDNKWSYGLNNIIQQVKIALGTPSGSLLEHPEIGLKIKVGSSLADSTPEEILTEVLAMFGNDPTFKSVKNGKVTFNKNAVTISLDVEVNGLNKSIPVRVRLV